MLSLTLFSFLFPQSFYPPFQFPHSSQADNIHRLFSFSYLPSGNLQSSFSNLYSQTVLSFPGMSMTSLILSAASFCFVSRVILTNCAVLCLMNKRHSPSPLSIFINSVSFFFARSGSMDTTESCILNHLYN